MHACSARSLGVFKAIVGIRPLAARRKFADEALRGAVAAGSARFLRHAVAEKALKACRRRRKLWRWCSGSGRVQRWCVASVWCRCTASPAIRERGHAVEQVRHPTCRIEINLGPLSRCHRHVRCISQQHLRAVRLYRCGVPTVPVQREEMCRGGTSLADSLPSRGNMAPELRVRQVSSGAA